MPLRKIAGPKHPPDETCDDVPGCSRQDPDETIKRRYRHFVQTDRPDKIAGKGRPDEFTQLAQDKFHEIQQAHETIKKERNIHWIGLGHIPEIKRDA